MIEPIILNLLPITKGGGMQGVLSFVKTLSEDDAKRKQVTIVCRDRAPLAGLCRERSPSHLIVEDSTAGRFKGESKGLYVHANAKLCFTFFGAPVFGSKGKFVNVCGCAYPNLFYPD